jgi:hypothetical protein
MKRALSILVIISLAMGLGFLAYTAFFGPDRIPLEGMSFWEVLKDGDFWNFLLFAGSLLMFAVFEVSSLRDQPPADIQNGVTAQARIVRMWDTGVTINDDPQVGILLEIFPPGGGAPFQAEARTVISRRDVPNVKPGTRSEVMYDPQKPSRLKIMALHVPEAAARNFAGRLEELETLREKKLISESEYRQKRMDILGGR